MRRLKEGAELIEGRMTFIQRFLQKKYGWGILYFTLLFFAVGFSVYYYNEGKKEGEKASSQEIKTLNNSLKTTRLNDSLEINTLNGRVAYYKKIYDSCNEKSNKQDLEYMVTKKIEEAERLKKILERKIYNDEKMAEDINSIIKK
ncbi:hypothetical protein [Chryseobacterium daeguense]|uniref:hypothetical protein n=1 Tax=Chryseobacterium daeguense TaxID=412438 RepID=UPI000429F0DB|nr:hypothetical protein [Chryseobacterium daeguense]